MFKIIKENKIIGVSENNPVLLDKYEVKEETEHTVSDYIQVKGEYVLTSSAEAIEQKKEEVRAIRKQYLEETDKFMIEDFPITEAEKAQYREYRKYLRDYTKEEGWYEQPPKTFEEWRGK